MGSRRCSIAHSLLLLESCLFLHHQCSRHHCTITINKEEESGFCVGGHWGWGIALLIPPQNLPLRQWHCCPTRYFGAIPWHVPHDVPWLPSSWHLVVAARRRIFFFRIVPIDRKFRDASFMTRGSNTWGFSLSLFWVLGCVFYYLIFNTHSLSAF